MRRIVLVVLALVAGATLQTATATNHYTVLTDVRVAMDDGVVMTADVYIPTAPDGPDEDTLYPCVVELTPYRKEGRASEGVSYLPGAGIALIEVDARGTGGSAGEYDVVFSVREQADAAAWVEWAATHAVNQSDEQLCESTVGMYGGSYSGIIQYLVASLPDTADGDVPARPPHLAAIAPQRAYGDLYRDIVYHGGMVIGSFGLAWSTATTGLYTQPPTDIDTAEGQAAWLDHLTKNDPMMLHYLDNPYADATYTSDDSSPAYTQKLYEDSSALQRVENMTVPVLHLVGFFDTFTRGQLQMFSAAHALESEGARGPNFLIAGPWNHGGTHFITPDQGFSEHLGQWYRYWLEGEAEDASPPGWIANGFDGAGARAMWFQSTSGIVNGDAAADGAWHTAASWPPEVTPTRLYLRSDGTLGEPDDTVGSFWVSNPTAGVAEVGSRWDNALTGAIPHTQLDQRLEGGKGLTFVGDELDEDLRLSGPINLSAWLSVSPLGPDTGHPAIGGLSQLTPGYVDTDIVVKLSDVAPDGTATLVTSGYLRASHRAIDPARSTYIDGELMAPYHPHTEEALDPPVGSDVLEPEARLHHIEIWPTAKTFAAGNRLRLDIYSADTPNHLTLLRPTLNGLGAAWISLPVLDPGA